MMVEYKPLSAEQWALAVPPMVDIAHYGTSLAVNWYDHPCSPYLTYRLALLSAMRLTPREDEQLHIHNIYTRTLCARPKGYRHNADFGLSREIGETADRLLEICDARPVIHKKQRLPASLAQMGGLKLPAPMMAVSQTRDMMYQAYDYETASLEAQRVLVNEGMFPITPSGTPLPIAFLPPTRRRDGDWVIGALKRLNEALKETCAILDECSKLLEEIETRGIKLRKGSAAERLLPYVLATPVVTLRDAIEVLEDGDNKVSNKVCTQALDTLEEYEIIKEIKGVAKNRAWIAQSKDKVKQQNLIAV